MRRIIEREAAGRIGILEQLSRESIVRSWLKAHGIPSWRNPVSPPPESSDSRGRYSILLADGSRFVVCPYRNAVLSFDRIASAGCFAVVAVDLREHVFSGTVEGMIFLKDVDHGISHHDFSEGGLEPASGLLHSSGVSGGYLISLLRFSIRLLILGEPYPPQRGTAGVRTFGPANTETLEV